MPRFGSRPDLERRRQVSELRAQGLNLREIGEQLGCSPQAVHKLLTHQGDARLVPIRCQECGAEITRIRVAVNSNRSVWCLACLAKHPKATFGQKLKCHRLSAGLTIAELAKRSGVQPTLLVSYEKDRSKPTQRTLDRLIRTLGAGLMTKRGSGCG
jgi:DNA-binding XRE family transcriptional regulator